MTGPYDLDAPANPDAPDGLTLAEFRDLTPEQRRRWHHQQALADRVFRSRRGFDAEYGDLR